jgi:chemotaxis protein CheX
MKAEHINPFLLAVQEIFDTMLGCSVTSGKIRLPQQKVGSPDVIGVIGLSGDAKGIVAVKMPVMTALATVGRMVGEEIKSVNDSVIDGIGEFVNIVAGSAKAKFEGRSLSLSLPTVVRGDIFRLSNQMAATWVEIPFSSELGEFSVAVGMVMEVENNKEKANECTSCR